MLKKIVLFVLILTAFAIPAGIAHAGLCEDIAEETKGFVTCGPEATTTFEGFKGGLKPPSEEGYEESLTEVTDARSFIVEVVNFATGFLGLIATVMLIYGGFLYLTARGEQDQTDKGKKTIGYTVAGILVILGSFAFVNTILKAPTGTDAGTGLAQEEGALVGTAGFLNNQVVTNARDLVTAYASFLEIKGELDSLHLTLEQVKLPNNVFGALETISGALQTVDERLTVIVQKSGKAPEMSEVVTLFRLAVNGWKNAHLGSGAMPMPDLAFDWTIFRTVLTGAAKVDQLGELSVGQQFDLLREEAEKYAREKIGFDTMVEVAGTLFDRSIDDMKVSLAEMYEPFGAADAQIQNINDLFFALVAKENLTLSKNDLIFRQFKPETCGATTSLLQCIKDKKTLSTAVSAKVVESAVNVLGAIPEALKNVKFAEARLAADALEGSAPLTVNFSTIGSSDPSDKTIQGDQIHWDLDGDGFNTGSDFFKKVTVKPESCDDDNIKILETAAHLNSARTCTYFYPGTYRVGVKIYSGNKGIVPGIAFVTVKVHEPSSRIRLQAHVFGLSKEVVIKKYSDKGFIEIDKPSFTVTLSQAAEGITFDADGTVSGSVDLEFDPLALQNVNETDQNTLSTIATMKWDFGDGTDIVQGSVADVAVVHPKHAYQKTGTYKVTLEVTDVSGNIDHKIVNVNVSSIAAFINIFPGFSAKLKAPITLDGLSSHSDKGTISTFQWKAMTTADQKDVSELSASKGKYVAKLSAPGTYSLSLKVIDSTGESATDQVTLTVESEPPVARFDWKPVSSYQPNTILFDAGTSFDPDGATGNLQYAWTIDEPETSFTILEGSLAEKKMKVKFLKQGMYHVTVKVSDKNEPGKESEEQKLVEIEDMLDVAWGAFDSSSVLQNGQAKVNVSAVSERAVSYEIDFGDSSEEVGGNFAGGFASAEHTYETSGTFTVSLTVFDEENNDKTISRNIFVAPDHTPAAAINLLVDNEPAAFEGEVIQVNRKQLITFDASHSLNADGTPRKLLYQWDFGDGVKSNKKIVTHAYKDLSPKQGYYEVTLMVTDKDDPSVTATSDVRVSVISEPPKFQSLTSVIEGSSLVTPVKVTVNAVGAEDPDGKIVQYRFWYFDVTNPDELLGVQVSKTASALLTIGTRGEEGEQVTYGFGAELTDSDNNKVSSEEILQSNEIPTVEVLNGANKLPVAKFSVDRTTLKAGESVTFSSTSSDQDGEIIGYVWDLDGDGFHNDEETQKPTLTHIYNNVSGEGISVRLKVIDHAYGEAISDPVKIFVKSNPESLHAVMASSPAPAPDGKIHLKGEKGTVTFDVSGSKGQIVQYLFDKNIYFDGNGNGIPNDDKDFSSVYAVKWTTEFQKSWGKMAVQLTVKDKDGNSAADIKEITFDASSSALDSAYANAFMPNANEATLFLAAFSSLGILNVSIWRVLRRRRHRLRK